MAGRHGGGPSAGGGGAGSLTRRGGFAARPAGVAGVGRRVRAGLVALAGLWALAAAPVAGQGGCGEVGRGVGGANAGQEAWPAPLDRPVTVQATSQPLRDVLDVLARAGGFRISYSADLLPLDRLVCVSYDRVPVGRVLAELVRGSGLEPVAAGRDHVVLAPVPAATAPAAEVEERAETPASTPVVVLDRLLVFGKSEIGPLATVAAPGTTVDAVKLAGTTSTTLPELLNAAVPGLWMWQRSGARPLARYGSIRGAGSFGASYPKVYIDGIEVANSQLIAHLTSDVVERVEVIRGPQGGALYGTDATSGVINIVTRHEDGRSGSPRVRFRSTAGFTESDHASGAVVAQEHALMVRTGSGQRSATLHLAAGSLGDYAPGASSRHLTLSTTTRLVGERSVVTGVGRLYLEQGGGSVNGSDVDRLATLPGFGAPRPYSVRQYTIGVNSSVMSSDRVVHTVVFGMDGYHLVDVPVAEPTMDGWRLTGGAGSGGDATRATLRAATRARLGTEGSAGAAITAALEHSLINERTIGTNGLLSGSSWRRSTGLVAQVDGELLDAFHLTSGVRLERNDLLDTSPRYSLLPMLGGALERDLGPLSITLRGAYGKGIRSAGPLTEPSGLVWRARGVSRALVDLLMEEQSGVEAGLDLDVGGGIGLHVTRFDQVARGPVHAMGVAEESDTDSGSGARWYSGEGLTAFGTAGLLVRGEIDNRGWELQGTYARGRLSMGVAASLVDSRVRALAGGYSGDLRPGDRVLGVPAWTVSVTGMWSGERWSGSVTAYRAGDWINYDRMALADAGFSDSRGLPELDVIRSGGELDGEALRRFWRRYDGATHLRVAASWDLRPYLSLLFTGDNLLNRQDGGPDNGSVRPGRTLTFGIRAAF